MSETSSQCRRDLTPSKYIKGNFYVSCCLEEDINTPEVRIYASGFDVKPPFDVIKLSHEKNICYVRVRTADRLYLKKFLSHIEFKGEYGLFADAISNVYGTQSIIFISEYYRRILGIKGIIYEVKDAKDLDSNMRELKLWVPTNGLCYLMYLFNSSLMHPQLEMRFRGIISIIALFFTLLNLYKAVDIITVFISTILFLGMFLSWRKINILPNILLILGVIVLCMNGLIISLFPSLSDASILKWFY